MPNLNNETKKRLYLNTLIFCLVGGVVSIALLMLLVYGGGTASSFVPLIVTVELGLLSVLIYALVVIIKNERKDRDRANNATDNIVAATKCPDYWTVSSDPADSSKSVCVRRYVAPPSTDGINESTSIFVVQGQDDRVALADYNNKAIGAVCQGVRAEKTPWSDLTPLCNAYRV